MTEDNIESAILNLSQFFCIKIAILRELCAKHGLIAKRKRCINWSMFLYVCVLCGLGGFLKHKDRRLKYSELYGITVEPNAFSDRLSDLPTAFLEDVIKLLEPRLNYIQQKKKRKKAIALIKRIFVEDSSMFSLNKKLVEILGKSVGKGGNCSMKLFLGFNVYGDESCQAVILNGKRHDSKHSFTTEAGTLRLRDRAWFSIVNFLKWRQSGHYFISRIKDGFNPLIVKVKEGCDSWEGKSLVDIGRTSYVGEVKLVIQPKPVKNKTVMENKTTPFQMELWGKRINGMWYWYIVELPYTKGLTFEDVHQIYRLRWEIEEDFREIKQCVEKGQLKGLANEKSIINQLYLIVICWLILKKYVKLVAEANRLNPHGIRLDSLLLSSKGASLVELVIKLAFRQPTQKSN